MRLATRKLNPKDSNVWTETFPQEWQELAKLTMGKKDFKSIYWLLLSDDDLFNLFEKVVSRWLNG